MADPNPINPIVPDFWRYFSNKKLSDVDIILIEEEAAAAPANSSKRKRQDGEHMFGHSQVLAGFSRYCRTKLEDWDDTDSTDQQRSGRTSKHEIQLPVPAGQLEVGRLLIRGMYQQQPDLSDISQAQLLQLLLLADRFEVPKVQAAASAAFSAMPLEQLQWETALAVYRLPGGCAELAACKDLFSAAAAKLHQELGDLELVLTDPEGSKAQLLLELPFAALKQLLRDVRTRVASENTVFCAIQQWHDCQQQQLQARHSHHLQSLQQQAKELLQLVRMLQCSQLFITTAIWQSAVATRCFSHQELLMASNFTQSVASPLQLPDLPVFQRHPVWRLPARPASAMQQLTIDWQLPLTQLKMAFEQHLETGSSKHLNGETRVWQALTVCPRVRLASESGDGSEGPSRQLGLYCSTKLDGGEGRNASIAVRAKSFKRGKADVSKTTRNHTAYTSKRPSWGWSDFVELGPVSSWAAAETELRNKGLVGSDNCLHLSLTVTDVQ